MVIVTNGDFSANNVGYIEINKDISEEVQQIATLYGGLTSKKMFALQDLYDDLNQASLWTKMKRLYLPIIANGLDKTMLDIKNKNVDWVPDDTKYELTSNGIIGITDGVIDNDSIAFSQTIQDLSVFSYNSSDAAARPAANGADVSHIFFTNDYNSFRSNGSSLNTYGLSGRVGSTGFNGTFSDGFLRTSYKGLYMLTGGATGTPARAYAFGRNLVMSAVANMNSALTMPVLRPFRNQPTAGNSNIRLRVHSSVYGVGSEFSFSEYQQLNSFFENFCNKLLV